MNAIIIVVMLVNITNMIAAGSIFGAFFLTTVGLGMLFPRQAAFTFDAIVFASKVVAHNVVLWATKPQMVEV